MNGSERSLEVFLNGFSARDLAEPLPSFDVSTDAAAVLAEMTANQFEVIGLRRSGLLVGWQTRDELVATSGSPNWHAFDAASVLEDSAPFNEVVRVLNASRYVFVRSCGQVNAFISRHDLQKPAMRMWLFGLITITELRVTRMIDRVCPNNSWQGLVAETRLQKAIQLRDMRLQRKQNPSLLECLQFSDKGEIVAREERLRQQTRFPSKKSVQKFVTSLQDLRNNLAHAHDISGDWKMICDLATNLHRIVLGPDASDVTATVQDHGMA